MYKPQYLILSTFPARPIFGRVVSRVLADDNSVSSYCSCLTVGIIAFTINMVFEENLIGLILVVCFLYNTNPNPRKNIRCGKKWPKCHL